MKSLRGVGGAGAVCALVALLALACGDPAQPVKWSGSLIGPDTAVSVGAIVPIRLEARAAPGWYFYSLTQPEGGPVPARIWLPDSAMFTLAGAVSGPDPSRTFDQLFGMSVEKFSGRSSFSVPVRIMEAAGRGRRGVRVSATYQACNDRICHSPRTATVSVPITIEAR